MKVIVLAASLAAFSLSTSAQHILTDGQLPKDLKITIDNTGTVQFANYYRSNILRDGSVTLEYTSRGLPIQRGFSSVLLLKGQKAPKPPVKKNKLSKKQLTELAHAIETSGFFEMKESYYGNPGSEPVMCSNHANAKAITVIANGKTKRVYFFLGCGYGEFEPLKKFLSVYEQIEKTIGGVKVREIQPATSP